MAISAGQVFVDLGARLDRREFDAYDRKLKETQERVARKERFKAQLGGDYDERAFRSYQRDLDRAERETHNMVQAQGRLRTAFGSVWARGGAAFAVAGGAAAIVAGAKSAVSAASDINESLTKNKTLFGAYARDVEKFSRQSADAFGISRSAALEYTGVFGNLSRAIGINEKDSARMSVRLTKLAADLASFNNTSIEDALEALRSGLVGETEPLRRFGVTLSAAAVQAEAMRSGLVKVSHSSLEYREAVIDLEKRQETAAKALKEHGRTSLEFRDAQIEVEKANKAVAKAAAGGKVELTNQQKAMATTKLIFRQTSQAQGDFSRTSQGAANQQRILRARLSDMQAEIGAKLLPVLVKGTQGLNHFIDGMRNGRGVGGQFASVLNTVGRALGRFGEDFNENERQVGGWITGFGRAESTVLKFTGTLVGGRAGDQLREWGRNVDRNADDIDRWREQLRIDKEVDGIERDIRRLRRTTSGSFRDIRVATKNNMDEIRDSMTLESAAGRRAFARNIRAAVAAIKDAMKDGRVSAKTGLAEIRKLMLTQLRELGIRSAERTGAPLTQDPAKANQAQRYMGGWLGGRGLVGHDTIPAMLAPGEAVLNRHQQAVIEGMLGEGFLDRLFAQVNRPHFMASGGMVSGDTDYVPALGRALEAMARSTGTPISVQSGRRSLAEQQALYAKYLAGTGNLAAKPNANAPHVRGIAADISPGRERFGSVAGRFGLGFTVPSESWHIQLLGAVGDALAGAIPGAGAVWRAIKAPRTTTTGLLGQVVQGTLDRVTRLANRRGRNLAATVAPAGEPAPGAVSGPAGSTADVRSIFFQALKLAGIPPNSANITKLVTLLNKENRAHSATITNPIPVNGEHATGWMQMLPSTFRQYAVTGHTNINDPIDNAAASIRYQIARYGGLVTHSPYGRGGFAHFQNGGIAGAAGRAVGRAIGGGKSKLARTVGGATAGLIRKIRPVQTDRSSRFDALMARVDAADEDYSRWERRFNISDEELVDADSGQVNVAAVRRKAKELGQLILIRAGMERDLEAARDTAKAIVASYRKVVSALRNSLRHAKKKNRKGIQSYINQYQPRIAEWQAKVGEVGDKLFDTGTDIIDLRGELKDVLGAAPEIRTPDTPDTADTSADTSITDTAADTTAAAPTPLQIAEAAAAEMRTFLAGRQELLTSFGRDFVPQAQGAGYFGSSDPLTQSAGLRAFGATSTGGLGGATIINNYNQLPDNTQTWSEQMRFIVGG